MSDDVFNRVETNIQTAALARLQVRSGEVCGREPFGSAFLVVQAYRGPLSPSKRGIEFKSDIEPQKGSGTPWEARWYYPSTPDVMHRIQDGDEFAAITADVINKQP